METVLIWEETFLFWMLGGQPIIFSLTRACRLSWHTKLLRSPQIMAQVKLTSVDEQEFTVPIEVAKMSETVRHMIEGLCLFPFLRLACGRPWIPLVFS